MIIEVTVEELSTPVDVMPFITLSFAKGEDPTTILAKLRVCVDGGNIMNNFNNTYVILDKSGTYFDGSATLNTGTIQFNDVFAKQLWLYCYDKLNAERIQ